MIRSCGLVAFASVLIALAGCNPGPNVREISGTVNLNGQPVTEGDIAFIPTDPKLGGEGGKIVDGKFKLKAKDGKNKVQIRAMREVPGKKGPSAAGPDAPPEAVRESIIPERYNEKTALEEEVGPGKTSFTFELKSP